jgi:hypothetical protein
VKAWLRHELSGFARETLLASDGAAARFFTAAEIKRTLAAHQQRDCSQQLYALLVFDEWYRQFAQTGRPHPAADLRAPA